MTSESKNERPTLMRPKIEAISLIDERIEIGNDLLNRAIDSGEERFMLVERKMVSLKKF